MFILVITIIIFQAEAIFLRKWITYNGVFFIKQSVESSAFPSKQYGSREQ